MADLELKRAEAELKARDREAELEGEVKQELMGKVYTPQTLAAAISLPYNGDNKGYIDDFITVMDEFNGALDAAKAGVGAAYIPTSAYFHVVVTGEGAERRISEDKKVEIVELFYNWRALGKNRAAIYGAAIRFASRNQISLDREVTTLREAKIPADAKGDFDNFKTQLTRERQNAAIWAKQFPSILAMNGAALIAISHHWDSENVKPWDAIVQSLGQGDVIDTQMYRTMFYLALHPIPLEHVEYHRNLAASGTSGDYVNAVSIRARCTPATTGALMVSAAAYNDFKAEPYFNEVKGALRLVVEAHVTAAAQIREDPAKYCPLASAFGKVRTVVDVAAYKTSMIILTAYILESVKGSLARSQSLRKFQNANARSVQRWRDLFQAYVGQAGGTLVEELQRLA